MKRIPVSGRIARPVHAAERFWSPLRVRIAAAFRKCGIGVDPVTAQKRTTTFYRASGMSWARALG
jgi:hypothetical protein